MLEALSKGHSALPPRARNGQGLTRSATNSPGRCSTYRRGDSV